MVYLPNSEVPFSLFYAIATVFQLCHGSDMMHEMRKRKPEPTFLLTQAIFTLPHHIGMVWDEFAFNYTVSYIQQVEETVTPADLLAQA